ncbi:MAG: hypothetical protein HYT34_00150 [Candidatus Ryanbacteria bacterium]|nr:hypothetical protein [Candidatus Ryanbacteria bacterium]
MEFSRVASGNGLLIGMTIGAGMFALPYAVVAGGIFWSLLYLIVTISIVTRVHLLYGHVLYQDRERFRLPGYVRKYLGENFYRIALSSRFFSYYGILLAYGVLGGVFLSYLLPYFSPKYLTILFFLIFFPLTYPKLKTAGEINLFFTLLLVLFTFLLFFMLYPPSHFEKLPFFVRDAGSFLPYGVFLFAFSAASVIQEVVDVFGPHGKRVFEKSIYTSTFLVAIIYLLFVVAVLGVAGNGVAEDALSSLRSIAGGKIFILGAVLGFFAITTSYIPLALEIRYTWREDVKYTDTVSWFLASLVPLLLYLLNFSDFVAIVSLVGALGVGLEGIMILLLAHRVLKTNAMLTSLLVFCLALGALAGILKTLGIF